ncbi:MAG: S9 family peptidase [Chlorobi bacterium]|nr:S9 family peptidase [Chlorobiota bacterium]
MRPHIGLFSVFSILLFSFNVFSQEKKPLDFSVYDGWKSISVQKISNDGKWVTYEINPQVGDGYAYLYNVEQGRTDSVPRGKSPVFNAGNSFWALKIVPQADSIRALKLKKVKKDKFPKDSLLVKSLESGSSRSFSKIKEFYVPTHGGEFVAVLFDKSAIEKDTTQTKKDEEKDNEKKKDKKKKFESKGTPFMVYVPATNDSIGFEKITKYSVAKNGGGVFAVQSDGDTTEVSAVLRIHTDGSAPDTLFRKTGNIAKIKASYDGQQCAFLFSPDTSDSKVYRLYLWNEKYEEPVMVMDTVSTALPQEWSVLKKGSLSFSKDGRKLFFGAGNRPKPEPKDTLTEDEKVHVDIWSWQDKEIQPMQKKRLSKQKDRAYRCVYNVKERSIVQLESKVLPKVSVQQNGDLDIALGYDDGPYKRASSWNGKWCNDVYKVNLLTGEKILLKKELCGTSSLSFNGEWFAYYEQEDSSYYAVNTASGEIRKISSGVDVLLCDELNDVPNPPDAYGIAGWSLDGKSLLVYDRFDIWKLDLTGKKDPVCITSGKGRENSTRFRYVKLDPDAKGIDLKESIMLQGFNEKDKSSGFYALKNGHMQKLVWGDFYTYNPRKAKDADVVIWQRSTFIRYPELEVTDLTFKNSKKITVTNPQQSEYNWGRTKLVDWIAADGKKHQGILVTPENLDTTKKYPVVVYFYERSSDRLYRYYAPKPSRSTVNWTFYASNGYVIFVPDIYYRTGDPGLCSYEAVVTGALAMADRYKFIDVDRMALQGQSWGGYQTAFLVTRTNLFKAAMAGAPVSNMTSAYGGIRWGTGMSRMFQYEHTQSRIGGTLWEKTLKYIENSPVFYVPQIETPLLIMHNDNDGAVPWYQGIEFFMALRRLDKPAWMLVYNNEEHNLTRRANEKDLSRRMMQFFDHYLKGKPMPVWMKKGIPATEKGEKLGYEMCE